MPQAIQGEYDGTAIRLLEKIAAKPNQRAMDHPFPEEFPIIRDSGLTFTRKVVPEFFL